MKTASDHHQEGAREVTRTGSIRAVSILLFALAGVGQLAAEESLV